MMVYKPIDVYRLAVDAFGEERVSLNMLSWHEKVRDSSYDLTIYFPEVLISSSAGGKHLIRDLYVKLLMHRYTPREEFKMSISMQGQRATVTLKEWLSGYGHSHLSNVTGWGGFCLGASNFATILARTSMTLAEEDWNMLFLSIPNYLKWESREGGPYKNYSNISYQSLRRNTNANTEFARFSHQLPAEVLDFTNRLELRTGPELEAFYNKYSQVKDTTGISQEYAEASRATADKQMKTRTAIVFHGKKIEGKVILGDTLATGKQVSQSLMDSYNNIINNELATFNQDLGHQQLKRNANTVQLFGETITF